TAAPRRKSNPSDRRWAARSEWLRASLVMGIVAATIANAPEGSKRRRRVAGNLEGHLEAGWRSVATGDLAAARRGSEAALGRGAQSPEAHTLAGAVAAANGELEVARTAYARAIELDPDYVEPRLLAAETAALEGDIPEALRLCEEALDVADDESDY